MSAETLGALAALAATAVVSSCATMNAINGHEGALPERATPAAVREAVMAERVEALPAEVRSGTDKVIEALAPVWVVENGETLRQVLRRWGDREGVDVVFLTDRMWTLNADWAASGTFSEAVADLCAALEYLPHPPHAGWADGGRSLVVRHRDRSLEAGGGHAEEG